MADEQLSGQIPQSFQAEPPSVGPVFPRDVDEQPIGRCHAEALVVMRLIDQLKATEAALKTAVTAWGDCRQEAAMDAIAAAAARGGSADFAISLKVLSGVIRSFDDDVANHLTTPCAIAPDDQSESLPLSDETP